MKVIFYADTCFLFHFLVFWTQIFCCFDLFEVVLVPNGHFCQFLQYFGENIRNFNDQMYQMGLKYEFFAPPKLSLCSVGVFVADC